MIYLTIFRHLVINNTTSIENKWLVVCEFIIFNKMLILYKALSPRYLPLRFINSLSLFICFFHSDFMSDTFTLHSTRLCSALPDSIKSFSKELVWFFLIAHFTTSRLVWLVMYCAMLISNKIF